MVLFLSLVSPSRFLHKLNRLRLPQLRTSVFGSPRSFLDNVSRVKLPS